MVETTLLITVVIGVSQIVKNVGFPSKYIPLINLVLGIGFSVFFFPGLAIQETILQGILVGLSASGLYDQTKKISLPVKTNSETEEES